MPKRSRRAARKKTPTNKRKRSYRSKATINRNIVTLGKGFPKRMTVTHKYSDIVTLVSSAGSVGSYLLSCNGMYDPDYTSTGHQPLFFDQLAAVYDHYTVIGSKATFRFMPASAAYNVPMTCLVMLNDDVSLITTNPIVNAEQTGSTIKFLQMDAGSSLVIKKAFSAKKTYGPGVLSNDKLTGSTTTQPSEQTFYQLLTQTTDLSTTQSVIIYWEIEYIAVWSELKDIVAS